MNNWNLASSQIQPTKKYAKMGACQEMPVKQVPVGEIW